MLLGTALVLLLSLSGTISGGRHRRKDLVRLRRSIINEKCPYPCTCPTKEVCEECEECPRQLDEPCSDDRPCDRFKGLVCAFLHDGDSEGVCRADTSGVPCVVYNKTYRHGETFSPDCRTQCACQNGTYGCSSLCPQEHISPEGSCRHPRLVELPGQCCREWMCDSQAVEEPPSCEPTFTKWSECSSNCGSGISTRRSNLNGRCESAVEARICQTRRCDANEVFTHRSHHHHLRRGHECKATHRLTVGVHLRFGPCVSKKRYRPKFCGHCELPGAYCRPLLSTTVKVDFVCATPTPDDTESVDDLLPEFLEPGRDLWTEEHPPEDGIVVSTSVQWVLKCSCDTNAPTALLHRVHRTAASP